MGLFLYLQKTFLKKISEGLSLGSVLIMIKCIIDLSIGKYTFKS